MPAVNATMSKVCTTNDAPTERAVSTAPRFSMGDRVSTKVMHPTTHTRLPRYVRGHVGTIVSVHGGHVFPDGHTLRAMPPFNVPVEWLYTECNGVPLFGVNVESLAPGAAATIDGTTAMPAATALVSASSVRNSAAMRRGRSPRWRASAKRRLPLGVTSSTPRRSNSIGWSRRCGVFSRTASEASI